MSSTCRKNVCVGLPAGSICVYNEDCSQGNFCSNGKCAAQLAVGTACTNTQDCINTATCDNGVCVAMFSLKIGTSTNSVFPPNFYPSCQTGYANTSDTGFVCDNAPTSAASTSSCTVPSKCMAADGVNYKYCQCGFDGNDIVHHLKVTH